MGKKKKLKAEKLSKREKGTSKVVPAGTKFKALSEYPTEPPTPIKVIPAGKQFELVVDGDNVVGFTHDRNGIYQHTVEVGSDLSSAMQQMKEWIENQYAGDSKVEAVIHPETVDETLDRKLSVAERFGGPGWREMMKEPGFAIGGIISPEDDAHLRKVAADTHADIEKRYGVNDQPKPVPNDKPSIHDLLVDAVLQRKEFGLQKYGTLLQAGNGRKSLKDALEEILDLAAYLMCVIVEEEEENRPAS